MENDKKKHLIKEVVATAAFALVGAVGMLVVTKFYGFYTVSGQSMENTYYDGEKLIIDRNRGDSYDYGDIVVFSCSEEGKDHKILVKRVVAKGGDTLDINFETGDVTLNGKVLDEPYIKEPTTLDEGGFEYPVTVPEGCYFCMGDNRNHSGDSRDAEHIGFIPEEDIHGKVVAKFPKWL